MSQKYINQKYITEVVFSEPCLANEDFYVECFLTLSDGSKFTGKGECQVSEVKEHILRFLLAKRRAAGDAFNKAFPEEEAKTPEERLNRLEEWNFVLRCPLVVRIKRKRIE